MKYVDGHKKAVDLKIAYVGGGSRGWARNLMNDLALEETMSGEVYLYDINFAAAKDNEKLGNMYSKLGGAKSEWKYKAVATLKEALENADFVVISILPGTFDEMHSDVHAPEKYGIYQPVGDSTGPGGVIRALRTIPMMEVIAKAVEEFSPNAWVINYTNPMALCVKALYHTIPKIKAFGCCHEVFGVQELIGKAITEELGIEIKDRRDIKVNVVGVNHFTWLTDAKYHNIDAFEIYGRFANKYAISGAPMKNPESMFESAHKVKFDLFRRYGVIAAAGDRHLSEFVDGSWYLDNPEAVKEWGLKLTPVSWRKENLKERLARSERLRSGEEAVELETSGEDGVRQIRALLGLEDFTTNVNLPNVGQIPNLPLGAVVETNAVFRDNTITPVMSGNVPEGVWTLVARSVDYQLTVARAAKERNLDLAFRAFLDDPLVRLNAADAQALFDEMVENTKEYLKEYI